MSALSLHHVIFTNEKSSNLPFRSASSFLQPAPQKDGSPTSPLFSTSAYQDLIQRQPTHPDGPTIGWDLGLDLLGDPMTAAEHKNVEVHQIKMKLRRLYAISIVFELLFGIWAAYTTVRYCIAFAHDVAVNVHVPALVFGVLSAVSFALVITSVLLPLFPQKDHPRAWQYAKMLLRAFYLVLLSACAVMNLVFVMVWHPTEVCGWDIDITWYTTPTNTISSLCHTTPFTVWITAALLRLLVTLTMALSFLYILRAYYGTRHPASEENVPKYTPYLTSDPEELSPISASSPLERSKSTFKFSRSQDSNHTLSRSSVTLPKSSSISTLAPSTSHSRSHSTPDPSSKDMSPPRISPPTSRRTSSSTHPATHHGPSSTQSQSPPSTGSEMPSPQTQQPVSTASSSPTPQLLRRTSRVSFTQAMASDTTSDISARSERLSGQTITRDSSEIRSGIPWKFSHRGTAVFLDPTKKTTNSGWDNAHVRHDSQTSGTNSEVFSSLPDDGKSNQEKDTDGEYAYGYGASGRTYPYLDMYNPPRPHGCTEPEHTDSQTRACIVPCKPGMPDASSEPRPLPRDVGLNVDEEQTSSGEEAEEEYVAMMGGFVRRMATIESLGSKEATSSRTGLASGSLSSSQFSSSQFSSVRFAAMYDSATSRSGSGYGAVLAPSRSRSGTPSYAVVPSSSSGRTSMTGSTAYLSFSSGGTHVGVNERGELLPSGNATSLRGTRDGAWTTASPSPHERHHCDAPSASGSSLQSLGGRDHGER